MRLERTGDETGKEGGGGGDVARELAARSHLHFCCALTLVSPVAGAAGSVKPALGPLCCHSLCAVPVWCAVCQGVMLPSRDVTTKGCCHHVMVSPCQSVTCVCVRACVVCVFMGVYMGMCVSKCGWVVQRVETVVHSCPRLGCHDVQAMMSLSVRACVGMLGWGQHGQGS